MFYSGLPSTEVLSRTDISLIRLGWYAVPASFDDGDGQFVPLADWTGQLQAPPQFTSSCSRYHQPTGKASLGLPPLVLLNPVVEPRKMPTSLLASGQPRRPAKRANFWTRWLTESPLQGAVSGFPLITTTGARLVPPSLPELRIRASGMIRVPILDLCHSRSPQSRTAPTDC